MTFRTYYDWEIAAWLVTALPPSLRSRLGSCCAAAPRLKRLEQARREFLVQSGRIVDGMLLDVYEVPADDGRTLTMLLFSYRIGGVDYECSQDITAPAVAMVDTARGARRLPLLRALPARQPAKQHRGRRGLDRPARGLPQLPVFEDPNALDRSHLEPGAH